MPIHPRLEKLSFDWQLHPLAAALIAAGMLAPGGALAATLTVTTLAEASGSACTLRDAVHAVNAQSDQGACFADLGSGAYGSNDSIVFAPALSGTITFAMSDPLAVAGPSALSIRRPVALVGPGSSQVILTCGSSGYRLLEIAASTPPVSVSGVTVAKCASNGDGGGILVTDQFSNVAPVVLLTDVVAQFNSVGSSGVGGGVAVAAANLGTVVTYANGDIVGNRSALNGGGIGIRSNGNPMAVATVTVTDSTVNLNGARGGGGALVQGSGSSVRFTRSTLDGNSASIDGGGILIQGSAAAALRDSTVSRNQASGRGGGIALAFAPAAFGATNSTISGNRAGSAGGGIYARGTGSGAITLRSVTVATNGASRGSGIMVENAVASALLTPANVVAINTIVAGNNLSAAVPDVDSAQPDNWDVSFGVVGTIAPNVTLTGTGNVTGVAVPPPFGAGGWLGPLQNNGGPTLTHELLTPGADPAVNAGDPAFSGLLFDQRGSPFTRVREGRIDIGAFESGALPAPATVPAPAGWALGALSAVLALAGVLGRRKGGRR